MINFETKNARCAINTFVTTSKIDRFFEKTEYVDSITSDRVRTYTITFGGKSYGLIVRTPN